MKWMCAVDLDLHVFRRVWDKYLKDRADPSLFTTLFSEYKQILFFISNGAISIEEAKEYLTNLLQSIFGEDLQPEEYEAIVNELLRVLKLEEIRTKTRSRYKGRGGLF